jgi:hypothetical protein
MCCITVQKFGTMLRFTKFEILSRGDSVSPPTSDSLTFSVGYHEAVSPFFVCIAAPLALRAHWHGSLHEKNIACLARPYVTMSRIVSVAVGYL